MQELNIFFTFFKFFVLKLFKFKISNKFNCSNILDISITFSVLNEDKSNDIIDMQFENRCDIFLTLFVFNFDKSILLNE